LQRHPSKCTCFVAKFKYVLKVFLPLILFFLCMYGPASAQEIAAIPKKDPSGKQKLRPALIRGPYLQVATPNSIVVRWRTDARARSRVRYGTALDTLVFTADDSSLATEHIVKLTGLLAETKYYYSIGGINDTLQGDQDNYFVTLPSDNSKTISRVGVFGDCGNNSINQRNVRNAFEKYLDTNYLNAWILLGDNTYPDGEDAEYQARFFNIYKDKLLKQFPLFPSPGNHDYHDLDFTAGFAQKSHEVAYYHNFSMPENGEAGGIASHSKSFYSYNIGNTHFLSLDSYGLEDGLRMSDTMGAQTNWVKRDLEANKNMKWTVAYWHHPPYTMGSHNSDNTGELTKIRENFITILERYGVDLVLCGHSHDYERSKLMGGHFGKEKSFSATDHLISNSTGRDDGTSNSHPYVKSADNRGTVYVVSGSAGQLGGTQDSFPHNAMYYSNATEGGAGMIEVQGNRLVFKWICADGKIRDQFTMMKDVNKATTVQVKAGNSVDLTASFIGAYKWNKSGSAARTLHVTPTKPGTMIYEVTDPGRRLKDRFELIVTTR
jgi:hypothetical protein